MQKLKLLFVEKLRELESSFVEISHEVVETDKVKELKTMLGQKPGSGQQICYGRQKHRLLTSQQNGEIG